MWRWCAVGFVMGFAIAAMPSCSESKCGPSSCATGCCDSTGSCVAGTATNACGGGGNSCSVCSTGQACQAGLCGNNTDGGCTPSPAGTCFPTSCSIGNALNIGAYCAAGGGQCAAYDSGVSCALDLDPQNGGPFCILVGCHQNSDCAEQACCTGDSSGPPIYACVPKGCLVDAGDPCPPPPVRPDAGNTDGGNQSPDSGQTGSDGGHVDGGPTATDCGTTTCVGGQVCCSGVPFNRGGISCVASCPNATDLWNCNVPADCPSGAPMCCGTFVLDAGDTNPLSCPFLAAGTTCQTSCPYSIPQFDNGNCVGADEFALCASPSDCASPNKCCKHTFNGYTLNFCAAPGIQGFLTCM
jgi:hypothetical protein